MNDLINIEKKILVIRGQQVMLDRDLAELYGVETKVLNQAVKRNIERFPEQFCFQLNKTEIKEVVTNCDHLKTLIFSPYNPYVFTEQGVAMLSAVLRSEIAIKVSIDIMNAFVTMRHLLMNNAGIISRISDTETKLIEHDEKIETLFSLMDRYKIKDKQGVFVKGQIFDAYIALQNLIKKAQKEIILIDNYIDLTILERFAKKKVGVKVIVYTRQDTPVTKLDENKFNAQYPSLILKYTNNMHDRFLIIDNTEIYHIGASLKDLGKKCFGFTKLEDAQLMINTVLNAV